MYVRPLCAGPCTGFRQAACPPSEAHTTTYFAARNLGTVSQLQSSSFSYKFSPNSASQSQLHKADRCPVMLGHRLQRRPMLPTELAVLCFVFCCISALQLVLYTHHFHMCTLCHSQF
ncbi:TPA: hypothetical protein ACH3X1_009105 [Trebouxia sp. C0004]